MELMALGAALIAVTLLMLVAARPKHGNPARFLTSWPVGQAYALSAMASAVAGMTLIVANWPR